jgi:hypothetical protein
MHYSLIVFIISSLILSLVFYALFFEPFPLLLSCLANPTKIVSTFVFLIYVTKEAQQICRQNLSL